MHSYSSTSGTWYPRAFVFLWYPHNQLPAWPLHIMAGFFFLLPKTLSRWLASLFISFQPSRSYYVTDSQRALHYFIQFGAATSSSARSCPVVAAQITTRLSPEPCMAQLFLNRPNVLTMLNMLN
jgi:hypothetical protein